MSLACAQPMTADQQQQKLMEDLLEDMLKPSDHFDWADDVEDEICK